MLIGYCLLEPVGPTAGRIVSDAPPRMPADHAPGVPLTGAVRPASLGADALAAFGCERVFTDLDDERRGDRPGLRAALEALREGDALLVPALHHLGRDIETVVLLVDRLHLAGVSLRLSNAAGEEHPAQGETLALVCRELARLIEPDLPSPAAIVVPARRRGRPQALLPKDIAKARRMLAGGAFSVPDVARTLGVSPATVYRYFPRRSPKAAPPDDVAP